MKAADVKREHSCVSASAAMDGRWALQVERERSMNRILRSAIVDAIACIGVLIVSLLFSFLAADFVNRPFVTGVIIQPDAVRHYRNRSLKIRFWPVSATYNQPS